MFRLAALFLIIVSVSCLKNTKKLDSSNLVTFDCKNDTTLVVRICLSTKLLKKHNFCYSRSNAHSTNEKALVLLLMLISIFDILIFDRLQNVLHVVKF